MMTPPTEAQLLAALEADDFETVRAIHDVEPAWLNDENVRVAYAFYCVNLRHLAKVNALLDDAKAEWIKVRTSAETLSAAADEVSAATATLRAEHAAFFTARETSEDDLDIFQAGYERGYAIGWDHAKQEKTS